MMTIPSPRTTDTNTSTVVNKRGPFKRNVSFGANCASNKRICLSSNFSRRNSATVATLYSSTDEDDDDSEDEDCYMNNQRKALKRSCSMRASFLADKKLNLAVSQYSDEDEPELNQDVKDNEKSSLASRNRKVGFLPDEKLMPEILPSSRSSSLSTGCVLPIVRRSSVDCDQIARSRCFEYLVSAIDEAWARYCDATSYAEDAVYGDVGYFPTTPASLDASDDDEEDDDENEDGKDDVEEGYKSASTNITEYESDLDLKKVSSQPSSVKLQQLKDRLLKAKYYLQDFVETNNYEDASAFWKRWDLIKYATVELVEDDDDDEVIESTIDELERGRLYGHS